ncbi:MAG: ACT domain-containing protein, partial [Marinilabiliales bacterium]
MELNLQVLKDSYSIFRFDKNSTIPDWATKSDFYSITKTNDELSIVCVQPDIDM